MTKERPILFSGPMVRAILEGRKTQTRRVVKPQPVGNEACEPGDTTFIGGVLHKARESRGRNKASSGELVAYPYLCPYGLHGDRLWVRETWKYASWDQDGIPLVGYQADGERLWREVDEDKCDQVEEIWAHLSLPENYDIDGHAADRRWRPSIHMPRWASRLTLEVTDVRVERLQEISEEDAKAEGHGIVWGAGCERRTFDGLWDSINAKRGHGWNTNPWVWVVEFKKVEED